MKQLYVFYDERCAFCRWCRDWVSAQEAYLPINFRARGAANVQALMPELPHYAPEDNLAVFSDSGLVYTGDQALVMILWALRDWRGWSLWLGKEENRPHARRLWNLIHRNRGKLGWILRGKKAPTTLKDAPERIECADECTA